MMWKHQKVMFMKLTAPALHQYIVLYMAYRRRIYAVIVMETLINQLFFYHIITIHLRTYYILDIALVISNTHFHIMYMMQGSYWRRKNMKQIYTNHGLQKSCISLEMHTQHFITVFCQEWSTADSLASCPQEESRGLLKIPIPILPKPCQQRTVKKSTTQSLMVLSLLIFSLTCSDQVQRMY